MSNSGRYNSLRSSIRVTNDNIGIVSAGYQYWIDKAGSRFAPTWKEIDPSEIAELLANVVVIHVLREPLDFVERITGENINENSHRHSMHINYREFAGRGPESGIWKVLESVVSLKKPSLQQIPYVGPNKDFLTVRSVICPISDDGHTVNKLLAFVEYVPRRDGNLPD